MSEIVTIAIMTVTELRRDRFVFVFAFFAVILLLLASFLGSLSIEEQTRMLVHLGFASLHLVIVGLSLFLGAWSLQREMERQTCLLILSRPLSRIHFIYGKWLGLAMLISFFWLAATMLHALLLFSSISLAHYPLAALTIWLEAMTLLNVTYFFSTFLRPMLSFALGLSIFLGSHWRQDLSFFAVKSKSSYFALVSEISQFVLPPFDRIELRSIHFLTENIEQLPVWSFLNLLVWIFMMLIFAGEVWKRRDLV